MDNKNLKTLLTGVAGTLTIAVSLFLAYKNTPFWGAPLVFGFILLCISASQ